MYKKFSLIRIGKEMSHIINRGPYFADVTKGTDMQAIKQKAKYSVFYRSMQALSVFIHVVLPLWRVR